jgi:hypothetical protein
MRANSSSTLGSPVRFILSLESEPSCRVNRSIRGPQPAT